MRLPPNQFKHRLQFLRAADPRNRARKKRVIHRAIVKRLRVANDGLSHSAPPQSAGIDHVRERIFLVVVPHLQSSGVVAHEIQHERGRLSGAVQVRRRRVERKPPPGISRRDLIGILRRHEPEKVPRTAPYPEAGVEGVGSVLQRPVGLDLEIRPEQDVEHLPDLLVHEQAVRHEVVRALLAAPFHEAPHRRASPGVLASDRIGTRLQEQPERLRPQRAAAARDVQGRPPDEVSKREGLPPRRPYQLPEHLRLGLALNLPPVGVSRPARVMEGDVPLVVGYGRSLGVRPQQGRQVRVGEVLPKEASHVERDPSPRVDPSDVLRSPPDE
mmetsp:Transcript_48205/g.145629  ORF Transcript_48205/g.145629 Transcript_48205/m.145629 type:complete len:328 (+) Transcript_48205:350-1333(+)